MILASYRDADGIRRGGLYPDYESYYKETFSPEIADETIITLKVPGYGYRRKKENARELAIRVQAVLDDIIFSLSWFDLCAISDFFYSVGSRLGLLREFRANGIC